MASAVSTGSQGDGGTFKIKGAVDKSFTDSLAVVEQGAAKVGAATKTWRDHLASLASVLKSGAGVVAALAIEQKNHYEMINAVTKATKDSTVTSQQYINQAIDPLTKEIKELVAAQKEQLAVIKQTQAAQQTSTATTSQLTGSLSSLSTELTGSSDKLNTLKFAAQNAFYGNYTAAITDLIGGLGGYAAAAGVVTTAIAAANTVMSEYETHQKAISAHLDEESSKLAKVTTQWHRYTEVFGGQGKLGGSFQSNLLRPQGMPTIGNPIEVGKWIYNKAFNPDSTVPLYDPSNPRIQSIYRKVAESDIKSTIGGYSSLQVKAMLREAGLDPGDIPGSLKAIESSKVEANRARVSLRGLYADARDGNGTVIVKDEDTAKTLGTDKYSAFKAARSVRANKEDLKQAMAEQDLLYAKLERTKTILEEAKKKTDDFSTALKKFEVAKEQNESILKYLPMAGGRDSLVKARDFAADWYGVLKSKYTEVGGGKSDPASLHKAIISGNKEQEALAKALLDRRKELTDANKAIQDFDRAAEKAEIEAGQKKVALLQEQLELRKAMGKGSFADTASTIQEQLDSLSSKDIRGRTALLNTQQTEHGKFLDSDFKTYVGTYADAYKELAATGTASNADLTKANQRTIQAAKEWKKEYSAVLDQFPQLKEKLEGVLSSTRVNSSQLKTKAQEEALNELRQGNQRRDNAALTTKDRLSANAAATEEVHAKAKAGLISQKQATEELLNLEKARAGMQRAITQGIEEQKRSINALKGTLASNKVTALGDPTDPTKKQQLQDAQKEVLRSKLDAIEQEYQAAIKAGKDQILAAEEASLKKKILVDQEAQHFKAAEDAKTAALKSAQTERLGGSASPLSGLNEGVTGGALQFSGFRSFGSGFGSAARNDSLYSEYQKGKVPDHLSDVLSKRGSYELGASAPAGPTINVNLSLEAIPPNVRHLSKQIGAELASELEHKGLMHGDGAPAMVAR